MINISAVGFETQVSFMKLDQQPDQLTVTQGELTK